MLFLLREVNCSESEGKIFCYMFRCCVINVVNDVTTASRSMPGKVKKWFDESVVVKQRY